VIVLEKLLKPSVRIIIMEMTICPRCQKPVENMDYARSGPTLMGATDPRIKCKNCGYLGLPIVLSDEGDGQDS
jgi:hypothetical protein